MSATEIKAAEVEEAKKEKCPLVGSKHSYAHTQKNLTVYKAHTHNKRPRVSKIGCLIFNNSSLKRETEEEGELMGGKHRERG